MVGGNHKIEPRNGGRSGIEICRKLLGGGPKIDGRRKRRSEQGRFWGECLEYMPGSEDGLSRFFLRQLHFVLDEKQEVGNDLIRWQV